MNRFRSHAAIAALCAFSLLGCGKKDQATAPAPPASAPAAVAFRVTVVDLGKSIGDDKRVKDAATTFGPNDTIYAVVATEGSAASVPLKARWTYGDKGQLVNEETRTIAPTGPAATEFHISKPSGFPAGKYKVEISADGSVVAVKEFQVS